MPVDRLAAELGAQPFLLVPRRLALAQLSGGIVRVEWDLLAHQIPSHLLAMSHDAIKAGLPDGQCVLPLDEIVRQFSPEIFLSAGPAADLRGIEVFSAPFQPLEAVGGARSQRPRSRHCRLRLCPLPSSRRFRTRSRGSCARSQSRPTRQPLRWTSSTTLTCSGRARPRRNPESLALRAPMPPALAEEERAEHAAEWRTPLGRESVPTAERERPAAKPAHRESALQDDLHSCAAHRALPAVGPLAVEVRVAGGVTLLSATSPQSTTRWPSLPPRFFCR